MAMGKAVDGDNAKTYLETTLGAALDLVDAHDHTGTTKGLVLAAALTNLAAVPSGDISLTADTTTTVTGASFNLSAGTWLINANVSISTVAAPTVVAAQIWDGTNSVVVASSSTTQNVANSAVSLAMNHFYTVAGATSISLRARTTTNAGTAKQNDPTFASTATYINAVLIHA